MFRVGAAIGVGMLGAAGLTGCAGSDQLEIFSERQTAEDLLPPRGVGSISTSIPVVFSGRAMA
ncbi:hypothetical protein JF66_07395 [Cryobacterium sp. MLB-32]|nr:hypothetical protein JF66_07395 [Cryobacterium sp. MLB-32]